MLNVCAPVCTRASGSGTTIRTGRSRATVRGLRRRICKASAAVPGTIDAYPPVVSTRDHRVGILPRDRCYPHVHWAPASKSSVHGCRTSRCVAARSPRCAHDLEWCREGRRLALVPPEPGASASVLAESDDVGPGRCGGAQARGQRGRHDPPATRRRRAPCRSRRSACRAVTNAYAWKAGSPTSRTHAHVLSESSGHPLDRGCPSGVGRDGCSRALVRRAASMCPRRRGACGQGRSARRMAQQLQAAIDALHP